MVCRAHAWAAATAVPGEVTAGSVQPPTRGVETWRGRAVVADPQFWSTWRQRNRMIYEGPVLVHDEMHHVSAEVFIYRARRVSPRSTEAGSQYDSNVVVVQFIGAGKLPPLI